MHLVQWLNERFSEELSDFSIIEGEPCEVLLHLRVREYQNEGEDLRPTLVYLHGEYKCPRNDVVFLHHKEF